MPPCLVPRPTRLRVALALLAALLSAQPVVGAERELIVSNQGNAVTTFARTAAGSIAPLRTLVGPATGLTNPTGLALDPVHDEIFVGNDGNHSVTVYARTATGDTAPLRTLIGGATGLASPRGVAVDLVHDELLVVNVDVNSVTVYSRTASGNAAPLRTIQGAATGLSHPEDLHVDLAHDELVVLNLDNSVTTFARTASGDVAPLRTLAGPTTGLAGPFGMAVDSEGDQILVTSNTPPRINFYPRLASGDTAPTRTLTGAATGLTNLLGVLVDPLTDTLLVTNSSPADAVTEYPLGAAGNAGPIRMIQGAATGLSSPFKMAVSQPPLLVSTGTGPTGGPHVKLFRFDTAAASATPLGAGFFAYDLGFLGGVQATLVQVAGGLFVVTGVGSGGGPHIKVFRVTDVATGAVTQIGGGFLAYDPGFTGGARVAASTDAAGNLLVVTGVGSGGGAHIKVFQVDPTTGDAVQLGGGFFAYDPGFLGGANVGAH